MADKMYSIGSGIKGANTLDGAPVECRWLVVGPGSVKGLTRDALVAYVAGAVAIITETGDAANGGEMPAASDERTRKTALALLELPGSKIEETFVASGFVEIFSPVATAVNAALTAAGLRKESEKAAKVAKVAKRVTI